MHITYVLPIDTTDVQEVNVTITVVDLDRARIKIQCRFITGSNAKGCMVVVILDLSIGSRRSNHTMTFDLTRDGNMTSFSDINATGNSAHYIYCYDMAVVSAYDIEEDGSIGRVAVPGAFIYNVDTDQVRSCLSQNRPSELN